MRYVTYALSVAGSAAVVVGVALVSVPAACVVGGVLAIVASLALERERSR
jgi:hypothetical protein